MPSTHHTLDAPDEAPRLDVLVATHLDISRNQAATLIAEGHVLVAGRREKASYRARAGERVMIEVPPVPGREVLGEDIPLNVVYEDDDVLVVDKPAGMVVHPAPGNWSGTLVNALKGRGASLSEATDEGREGIVHRLDKETSGLLLVAKTDRAHRRLGAALQAREIVRRYAVLSWGHLTEERVTVEKPIARDPRDRKRMAVVSSGRPARTDLTRLARFDSADLLRAHLFTGRTHQIRVHLASIGHPVVGDDTYGGGGGRKLMGLPPRRHFLHAAWLIFRHPVTGEPIDLRSPLPEELHRAIVVAAGPDVPVADTNPLEFFGFYRVDT
ncbi:MAG TPA: RluA family pseudouridine synthase [Gemmatimonadaceae bacterium]|jgi:23S rRNA pseudouridine1911/1915/1917 synthase|nr:RluA family pseudouridine synthase [Gemmatimonadaceae bacterium]